MQENNQTDVKKILLDLADHLGAKGIRGLANALGENESKLYAWINRGTIGDQAAIIKKCPTIRTQWLETGQGEMFDAAPEPAAPASTHMLLLNQAGQTELAILKAHSYMENGCIRCKNIVAQAPYLAATMISESPQVPDLDIRIAHSLVAAILEDIPGDGPTRTIGFHHKPSPHSPPPAKS